MKNFNLKNNNILKIKEKKVKACKGCCHGRIQIASKRDSKATETRKNNILLKQCPQ